MDKESLLKLLQNELLDEKDEDIIQQINDTSDIIDNIPNESKKDKFIRLAEKRTNGLIEWIDKLDNLSNKNNYEYTDEQVKQIFSYIEERLSTVKNDFLKSERERNKFSFK